MSDGGLVGLDWAYLNIGHEHEHKHEHKHEHEYSETSHREYNGGKSDRLIVLHHGLGGSSESDYIVHLVERLLKNDFQVSTYSTACNMYMHTY